MSDEKSDRLMSREEYEEFDLHYQIQKIVDSLTFIVDRMEKLERVVYGQQYNNSDRD